MNENRIVLGFVSLKRLHLVSCKLNSLPYEKVIKNTVLNVIRMDAGSV